MPYMTNKGAQLYYEEQGRGNAILFLHGAGLNLEQWKRQMAVFSRDYRVIALDARGHGKSSLPKGKVEPDVFWQDVVALLDHLQIEKAILCGLSMGGHVALQAAIHAGDRVERLILIGAICTNRFNLYERIVLPINRFSLRCMPMSLTAACISAGLGRSDEENKRYIKNAVFSIKYSDFQRVWKAVTSMESRDGLESITCRTLLLIGERDTMTKRQQQYMSEHIKDARLSVIRNANHCTNLDNPEQVELEIKNFFIDTP